MSVGWGGVGWGGSLVIALLRVPLQGCGITCASCVCVCVCAVDWYISIAISYSACVICAYTKLGCKKIRLWVDFERGSETK